MTEPKNVSLTEDDYLSILTIIDKVYSCETINALKDVFDRNILPLLGAHAVVFALLEKDIADVEVIDAVNIPQPSVTALQLFLPNNQLSRMASTSNRPVVAYDVDRDKKELDEEMTRFFHENPQYKKDLLPYVQTVSSVMVAIDRPEPNLGFGIHRLNSIQPMTHREIRIMELLRSHLIKALRYVVLKEEFHKFKSITEALTNSPTAVALINRNTHVLFLNQAFKSLFSLQAGQLLPDPFASFIKGKIVDYKPDLENLSSVSDLPFFNIARMTFWITLIPVTPSEKSDDLRWIIKLKPVSEPHSRTALEMEQFSLTPREMEICWLVKDGIENQEIATRLFIAQSTVVTHLRSIFSKFNVNSRVQLIQKLNLAQD